MINKKSIFTLFRGLGSHKVVYDKRSMQPVRDWLFGLLFFVIIVVAGCVYSAYTFVSFRNLSVESPEPQQEAVTYNSTLVTNALRAYEMRQNSFVALQGDLTVASELQTASSTESSADESSSEVGDESASSTPLQGEE